MALTVVLVLGSVALLIAAVTSIVEPRTVSISGLAVPQRQGAETALYVAAFAVILPLGVVVGPRLAAAIASGPNGAGLSLLSAVLAASLAGTVLAARVAGSSEWGDEGWVLVALTLLWAVAAVAAVARAEWPRPWRSLQKGAALAPYVWALAGMLSAGSVLAVTHLRSVSVMALALAAVTVPAAVATVARVDLPRPRGRTGAAVDVLLLALVLLAVPDLVVITPEDPGLSAGERIINSVIQFHADFLVGPANQVLGGGAMLVDTSSQYGVGSIYFLTGWFQLEPVGYGTLSLFDGVVTALFFAAGYLVLRMAGASRPLSAATLAIGVVVLVFNREYPVGALLQEGPLRFGLPMALVLATVAGARWPHRARVAASAAIAVVAVSSVWAFEAFAYTAATFAAMACFTAWLLPPGERRRFLARQAALAAAACVAAHVLFAATTLVATGQLPAWGQYLSLLKAFLLGELGEITYDFSRWSPALGVGAAYLAGATALVTLARLRPELARQERVALLALTGITAYGILSFSYFVNRSADHVLPYVSLQALLAAALWLTVARRHAGDLPRRAGAVALACALAVAVLLVAVAWSSIGSAFDRSALGHMLPGGDSTGAALGRLRDFPPIDSRAPDGERLLARYMPGQDRVPVVVAPALATEILVRSRRSNQLRIADAVGESYVPKPRLPVVREAVEDLRPGDRMLVDLPALSALAAVRANPDFDPIRSATPGAATERLQVYALQLIDRRFRLRPIHRDDAGFVVVQLAPRS